MKYNTHFPKLDLTTSLSLFTIIFFVYQITIVYECSVITNELARALYVLVAPNNQPYPGINTISLEKGGKNSTDPILDFSYIAILLDAYPLSILLGTGFKVELLCMTENSTFGLKLTKSSSPLLHLQQRVRKSKKSSFRTKSTDCTKVSTFLLILPCRTHQTMNCRQFCPHLSMRLPMPKEAVDVIRL